MKTENFHINQEEIKLLSDSLPKTPPPPSNDNSENNK